MRTEPNARRPLGLPALRDALARLAARIDAGVGRAGDGFAETLSRGATCTGCCAI